MHIVEALEYIAVANPVSTDRNLRAMYIYM